MNWTSGQVNKTVDNNFLNSLKPCSLFGLEIEPTKFTLYELIIAGFLQKNAALIC